MSDEKKPTERESATVPGEPTEVDHSSERTLSMFRRYLLGDTVPVIARAHGVSDSTVYRAITVGGWREKKRKVEQRDYNSVMHEVMNKLDAERAMQKALAEMRIFKLDSGLYAWRVEVRVPPGGQPFGMIPPHPCVERITTPDGRFFIQYSLTQADVESLVGDKKLR
jgi:transposase-like protein